MLAFAVAASLVVSTAPASADGCTTPFKERGIEFLTGDELRRELVGNSITWEDEGLRFVEHYKAGTIEGEIIGLEGERPYREAGRWRIVAGCFCLEFENDAEEGGCYTIGRKRDRETRPGALAALVFYTADGRKEGPADLWQGNLVER
ncbi:MAG: hypothetical protein ACREJ0_06900 [Geminicoccaceae bacterium]